MNKIQPTTDKKKSMDMKTFRNWILLELVWILITMYIYGMLTAYVPEVIHIGFGQYLSIREGILLLMFLGMFILTGISLRRGSKRD